MQRTLSAARLYSPALAWGFESISCPTKKPTSSHKRHQSSLGNEVESLMVKIRVLLDTKFTKFAYLLWVLFSVLFQCLNPRFVHFWDLLGWFSARSCPSGQIDGAAEPLQTNPEKSIFSGSALVYHFPGSCNSCTRRAFCSFDASVN